MSPCVLKPPIGVRVGRWGETRIGVPGVLADR